MEQDRWNQNEFAIELLKRRQDSAKIRLAEMVLSLEENPELEVPD